jgi:tetratricopeptide (TPR) repeat protein
MKYCFPVIVFLILPLFLINCAGTNHSAKGVSLMKQGRLEEAYDEFLKAYEKNPDSPYVLNNIGYVYEMKDGNYSKAAGFYSQALEKCTPEHTIKTASDVNMAGKPLKEVIKQNLRRVEIKLRKFHEENKESA